jgi:ribosomal protein L13E
LSTGAKKRAKDTRKKGEEQKHLRLLKPTGAPPVPSVNARHDGNMVARGSRGFSYGEVGGAGFDLATAKRWRLPLDLRRRSVLEHNVEVLKSWHKNARPIRKTGELKKIEEELGKVEREVKKGVAKAKKEVVKVEKKAGKLEKEAVGKVEEPVKARRRKKKNETNSE